MTTVHSTRKRTYIPVITSAAGMCLTVENWQQAGIVSGLFSLETLLVKPGFDVLKRWNDLRSYTGWHGTVLLDPALPLHPKKQGSFLLRSVWDGTQITVEAAYLREIMAHLQADEVLGCDKQASYVISDKPAANALQGWVAYTPEACLEVVSHLEPSWLLLSDTGLQTDQSVLSADCGCPTCKAGYTRSYLHHLMQQVPLLAYRFLIMHNVYYYSQWVSLWPETDQNK